MIFSTLVGQTRSRESTRFIVAAFAKDANYLTIIKYLCLTWLVLMLAGCENLLPRKAPEPAEPTPTVEAPPPLPDASPMVDASKTDILFAQRTLNSLGYALGTIDGIWGPRSAKAIRDFERKYGLTTANGLLSPLNLYMLEKISNTDRNSSGRIAAQRQARGITAKLDQTTPLETAPQLVILEKNYSMLAKPNPFSEEIAQLIEGTGVYVISLQEGWYEVESEAKQKGYIKAD